MNQGSALSPLLFVTIMEAISREFRVASPWELYADDLVVKAETEDDLIKMLFRVHREEDCSAHRCVQSSVLRGSETWPVRKENEVALQWAEIRMVRLMGNIKVKDPSRDEREIRNRQHNLDTKANSLRWYGHVL